jgi:nitrogen fixation/metabolism regulation signal transduction histidine kinase
VADIGRRLIRLARRLLPALAIFVLLAGALTLASDAAAGSARFGRFYAGFLVASALALLVLLVVIVQRIARLLGELRRQLPGARLTRRVLLMLIALAVPPVLVVYGFSLFFLNATIDNWFNVRLEQGLGDALEIARVYLDERLAVAEQKSRTLAAELATVADADLQGRLDAALDAQGSTQLTVFGDNGTVLATASSDPRFLSPAYPDAAALLQLQNSCR